MIRCRMIGLPMLLSVILPGLACSPAQQIARNRTPSAIMTRTIEVDGLPLRVRVAGLEDRSRGEAAVIFESGGGMPLETWDSVLFEIADFAPVVAYDRAGTGQSRWDGVPPTPELVTQRLRRVLAELGVPPPYILVGHSWGGALVRYFAGTHEGDVVGILYIDPTDISLTRDDMIAMFESFGAGAAEYDAFNRIMEQATSGAPAPLRAEAEVIMNLMRREVDDRGLPAIPDVPTSVIVAGRVPTPPQSLLPVDARAFANAMHATQVRRLSSWVRNGGGFHVAEDAGHFVQADDPQLVIAAVRDLVRRSAARSER